MDNNTKQKIQEVLYLLSKERVNTTGLGAPISILKTLLEDVIPASEPSDKIPSFKEYIKTLPKEEIYLSAEKWNKLFKVAESYALLREQRAVEHEQDLCNQRLDELSAHYEAKILEAVEVERKKWEQFIVNRIDLIPDDDDLPLSQRGLLDAYINCLNYFKSTEQ